MMTASILEKELSILCVPDSKCQRMCYIRRLPGSQCRRCLFQPFGFLPKISTTVEKAVEKSPEQKKAKVAVAAAIARRGGHDCQYLGPDPCPGRDQGKPAQLLHLVQADRFRQRRRRHHHCPCAESTLQG